MEIVHKLKSTFLECEATTIPKVLLNPCDYLVYGITDSNYFYRNYYADPANDYVKYNRGHFGTNIYSRVQSYHIIANMICIKLPKSICNMKPFKMKAFTKCCYNLKDFSIKNEIKEIHTPVFGTKILEGNWQEILNIMQQIFNETIERMYIYG